MSKKVLSAMLIMWTMVSVAEEPTDEQRCQEWAEMDGIAAEEMSGYMTECLSSLNYEESVEVESDGSEAEVEYEVSQTAE